MLNKTLIAPARQQAITHIQENRLLAQVYQLEKERLEQIVDLALMVEDPASHWREYERLKRMASRFVGWDANHPELKTTTHYEVMVNFIDWLLPESEA
jgi:hypothetical protein